MSSSSSPNGAYFKSEEDKHSKLFITDKIAVIHCVWIISLYIILLNISLLHTVNLHTLYITCES